MQLASPIAILRIFDEQKARAFYVDFLGFRVDWEHRFEPALPLYLQVSRAACHQGSFGTRLMCAQPSAA